ncbi:MAG: endonuclease III [Gemmatimonadota bacterium]|nr:MAG: endonuclease III [Gemmatimonadota bacterium]
MGTDRSAGAVSENEAARLAERVESRLRSAYGAATRSSLDPLDELVQTVLSQNTSDVNRDRAWANLRREYGSWEDVLAGGRERLERTIRPAGLARQKSATILRVLETVREDGAAGLDHLQGMSDEIALDYLTEIRGVGKKTAACVLCFALHRPVMPVDTHVLRLTRRLGLVPAGATAGRAHDRLNAVVPPELRFSLHVQLIRHGRAICRARRPDCARCGLSDLCPRIGLEGA